jgi:hypothetical protein
MINDDQRSIVAAFLCFMVGVAVCVILTLSGCHTGIPKIDAEFWAGDSKSKGISRKQEGQTIPCDDPVIDDYVCLSYEDLQKIYHTLLQCKQWSGTTMSTREQLVFFRKNRGLLEHVAHKNQSELIQ